jgi:hypothetical protein
VNLASGRRGHVQHEDAATALSPVRSHRPSTTHGPASVTSTNHTAVSSHRGAQSERKRDVAEIQPYSARTAPCARRSPPPPSRPPTKAVRVTLNLPPQLYRQLAHWADFAAEKLDGPRVSVQDALRSMVWVGVADASPEARHSLSYAATGPSLRAARRRTSTSGLPGAAERAGAAERGVGKRAGGAGRRTPRSRPRTR